MSEQRSEVRGQRSAGSKARIVLLVTAYWLLVTSSHADSHYVVLTGLHIYPFTNVATAATNIQAAIDAATAGDLVRVSKGVYDGGGRAVAGGVTNCVVIDKAVRVHATAGPGVTVIKGLGPVGPNAVRCVYISCAGAYLDGFTLTNGCTLSEGDLLTDRSGGGVWCAAGSLVSNCVVRGNSASGHGGGAYADGGTLNRCVIEGNFAMASGGGAYSYNGLVYNCSFSRNRSGAEGGGLAGGTAHNCTIVGNTASSSGGGAYGVWLNNCILWYNDAVSDPDNAGGGTSSCVTPKPNGPDSVNQDPLLASISHLSSGSPCVGRGKSTPYYTDLDGESWLGPPSIGCDEYKPGAVTDELSVAISAVQTQAAVGVGLTFTAEIAGRTAASRWTFGDGVTISNRPFATHIWTATGNYPVVLTAFNESFPAGVDTAITVHVVERPTHYVVAHHPTPAFPYTSWATAASNIQDAVDAAEVAGAVIMVSNGVYDSGGRPAFGTLTNRVMIDKTLDVRSVNGAEVTIIRGQGPSGASAVRCAYLFQWARMTGLTLTEGHTQTNGGDTLGGGVLSEAGATLSNCVLTGNSAAWAGGGSYGARLNQSVIANNSAQLGGGAYGGFLRACLVVSNVAGLGGGGVASNNSGNSLFFANRAGGVGGAELGSIMYACTVVGNSASNSGGGLYGNGSGGAIRSCIVWGNSAPSEPNYSSLGLNPVYCCTDPLPAGTANISTDPMFRGSNDFRLEVSSPCVDTGQNQTWMFSSGDLDGHKRIINGRSDMGCYETPYYLKLKVLLEGSYRTNTHLMTTNLASILPPTTPYASAQLTASVVPSNATDWIHLRLTSPSNGAVAVDESLLLRADGYALSNDGTNAVPLDLSAGNYYLEVRHRNHLTVRSAWAVAFTNLIVPYDFTTSSAQFHGGTNGAVLLEPGVWGMVAGDADGDGKITATDRAIVSNQVGKTGYLSGDLNLDGVVNE